jgi:hypothetical protein
VIDVYRILWNEFETGHIGIDICGGEGGGLEISTAYHKRTSREINFNMRWSLPRKHCAA